MKTIERIEYILLGIAVVWYIIYMFRNKDFTPNPIAFGIWLLVGVTNVITYKDFSTFWKIPGMMLALNVVTFWVALRRAKSHHTKELGTLECICLSIAVAALVLRWLDSIDSTTANLLAQVALAIGFVPLLRRMIRRQEEEPYGPWIMLVIGFIVVSVDVIIQSIDAPISLYQKIVEISYPVLLGVVGDAIVVGVSFNIRLNRNL